MTRTASAIVAFAATMIAGDEQNPMMVGQAEVAELVRYGEALVTVVADARRIEDSEGSARLEKTSRKRALELITRLDDNAE